MSEQQPASTSAEQREALLETAALWRAQLDSGSADLAEFERWRAADPMHAVAFARISSTWSSLEDMAAPAVETSMIVEQSAPLAVSRRRALAWMAGAVTFGAAGLIARQSLAREKVATSTGERRSINLPLSVRLDMNTATSISWRASQQLLKLWLGHGEIAVRIGATAARLFVDTSQIEALLSPGFYNARLLNHTLDLTVIKGSARLRSGADNEFTDIREGQRLLAASGAVTVQAASAQALQVIDAWQRGEILFHDTQLSAAVAEYNRYLQNKLVILDPEVGKLRIGGRFTSADAGNFLRSLEITLRVTAVQSNGNIVLVRKT